MRKKKDKILRQSKLNRFVHWVTAISIFMLIITGLGQLPLYGRYLVVQPFGTRWLTSYEITLWVHYVFAAILIFVAFYHVIYHLIRREFILLPKKGDIKGSYELIKCMILKKKEPPQEKYLPEQRLAYLYFVIAIGLAIISGMMKVIKNIIGIQPTNGILLWGAVAHNIATVLIVLGIIMHLAAFIFKENRKLLPGMFTGYVDKNYIKERHSLWYREITNRKDMVEKRKANE